MTSWTLLHVHEAANLKTPGKSRVPRSFLFNLGGLSSNLIWKMSVRNVAWQFCMTWHPKAKSHQEPWNSIVICRTKAKKEYLDHLNFTNMWFSFMLYTGCVCPQSKISYKESKEGSQTSDVGFSIWSQTSNKLNFTLRSMLDIHHKLATWY